MKKSNIRKLVVINSESISANMKRITFGGNDLKAFPSDQQGAYVKLNFPHSDEDKINIIDGRLMSKTHAKPLVRTYTISKQNPDKHELDIDFVIHSGDSGPASTWAINAERGSELYITGPGPKKEVNYSAPWFFLVGDMTALPALSVILETLPKEAKGYLVLNIVNPEDRQELNVPDNIETHWIESKDQLEETSSFCDKVKTLPFLDDMPYVWVACEFTDMKLLRQYFKKEQMIPKQSIYISSYWKKGITEDQHKVVKRKDLENPATAKKLIKSVFSFFK